MAVKGPGKKAERVRVTLDLGPKHLRILRELEEMTEAVSAVEVVRVAICDYYQRIVGVDGIPPELAPLFRKYRQD